MGSLEADKESPEENPRMGTGGGVMIKVKWVGVFISTGNRKHTSRITFTGESLSDIHDQIKEFVECMEDDPKLKWELQSNEITSIES